MQIEDLLRKIKIRAEASKVTQFNDDKLDISPNDEPLETNPKAPAGSESRAEEDNSAVGVEEEADVVIVVALDDPEAKKVKQVFSSSWSIEGREGVTYRVAQCDLDGAEMKVVLAVQNDMGMVSAAILATKSIRAWKPKFVGMTGICAGVRGEVNLGDIIVAKKTLDYGSGKIKEGKLTPDYSPISLDADICSRVIEMAGNDSIMSAIRDKWPLSTGKPATDLSAHVGSFGSGAAVISDATIIDEVRQYSRSLIGIDMEAYAVVKSASEAPHGPIPCMVVKGVQDFADSFKSDDYREYSAYASSSFMYEFLRRNAASIVDRHN